MGIVAEPAPAWKLHESNRKYGKMVNHALEHMRRAGARPPDRNDIVQFLAFTAPLAAQSQSQLFQDLWALWVSGGKRDGYFVEFGAADGVNLSNTYFLETGMQWSGIVAEPHPAQAVRARAARRCHVSDLCVYSRSDETLTFRMVENSDLSRLADINPGDDHEETRRATFEETQVRTISLNDLLASYGAPRDIDYLSIDTEGSELEILQAFDFDRWNIRAVTVEHNYTAAEQALDALFLAKGYRRMWPELSRYDAWYIRD